MLLNRFCTFCKERCEKQVYWRPVNGIEYPYCSIKHWFAHRKEVENEQEALADQNEAGQTSGEVLPQDFIKSHHEVGTATQAEMTFDHLRGIW